MTHRLNIVGITDQTLETLRAMSNGRGWTMAECLEFLTLHLRTQHAAVYEEMKTDADSWEHQQTTGVMA